MDDETWKLLVAAVIRQGVVKDEAEFKRRLAAGEQLTVNLPVKQSEIHGIYGTMDASE